MAAVSASSLRRPWPAATLLLTVFALLLSLWVGAEAKKKKEEVSVDLTGDDLDTEPAGEEAPIEDLSDLPELPEGLAELRVELGESLTCSACAWSTAAIRATFGAKVKSNLKKAAKKKATEEAFTMACDASKFPKQLAVVGTHPVRTFEDLYKLVTELNGKDMPPVDMENTASENVPVFCKKLLEIFGDQIREKAVTSKTRIGGYNFENWLCVKELKVCRNTLIHEVEDDDEEATHDEL
mmetsp:Transcript_1646/g.3600  ORF Transcript_1646/g.3600 Transcript_1646/m.3600 type:complete len:239 (+) Transcript_1646:105-821(+)